VTAAAAAVLAVTLVADVLAPRGVLVLTVFYGLAPLIASAVQGPVVTAAIGTTATLLAVVSGAWTGTGPQHVVRWTDVLAVSALSTLVAGTRTRRERTLAETERIASAAQQALLPVLPAHIGPVLLRTRYHSATRTAQVGGDFFDFVADGGRLRLVLGDVSGKGVDAVAQAARVIRAFRQYGASEADLVSVARRVDEYVEPFWNGEYYATAVFLEVHDREPDLLNLVSAGHPAPLHRGAAGVAELPVEPCLPLGLGAADAQTQHLWAPGERLLLYTDGLVEARDATGAFLPRATIDAALSYGESGDVDAALDALLEAVEQHSARFSDDLALMLLERVSVPAQLQPPAGARVDATR
jgi:serine phosphatase RsbU (regulator of sigma subunit)